MPNLIVVRRYDEPTPLFGIHCNAPKGTLKPGIYWTVGLFTEELMQEKLEEFGATPSDFDAITPDDIVDCAPIEWHKNMEEWLDRFTVYAVQ